jgi:hypothetical protein
MASVFKLDCMYLISKELSYPSVEYMDKNNLLKKINWENHESLFNH